MSTSLQSGGVDCPPSDETEAGRTPMAELDTIRKELETLLKEVKHLQSEAAKPAAEKPATAEDPSTTDAESEETSDAIAELQTYLATKAGEAGEALEEHPLVVVAAAFVLGLVAGRLAFR
jgi:ElaB/YqjD/DUF883 family membrane-anchored ribosome-binding protein